METRISPALDVELSAMEARPSGLYIQDLVVGEGIRADSGDVAKVHYAGWLPSGMQFDARREGPGLEVALGYGRVIAGWDQGVVGMRVGGRRLLVVPPGLAYGAEGRGEDPRQLPRWCSRWSCWRWRTGHRRPGGRRRRAWTTILDGRVFRSVVNTENGEVGSDTVFHYHQSGRVVWAEYSGGAIRGRPSRRQTSCLMEGWTCDTTTFNRDGEIMIGTCLSTPEPTSERKAANQGRMAVAVR